MAISARILVVQAAGLGFDTASVLPVEGVHFAPLKTVFPAVTCAFQGSFRTASLPGAHGMVANGLFWRDLRKVMFWEQSSGLVRGPRLWDAYRKTGKRVGMLFWQQSMGESVDVTLSPAPIHLHHGGMIQDCYCQPAGLYASLTERIGRPFRLRHYWGPLASGKAGDWIADATCHVIADEELALDLCFTYLPTLDYAFQRHGPQTPKGFVACGQLASQLERILSVAHDCGWGGGVVGDYAIGPVDGGQAICPNRLLAESGLLATREVRGMHYPDLHMSQAFVVVDHEVAHVYIPEAGIVDRVAALFTGVPGVAEVLNADAQGSWGVAHANSGELVLVAEPGHWFGYPWWQDRDDAPDYATHIDIHNKPGFDPCELFWSWWPPGVSLDTSRVMGSHGRAGPDRDVAWASTVPIPFPEEPKNVVDLAAGLQRILEVL